MKKIISMFMVLAMVLCLVPAVVSADTYSYYVYGDTGYESEFETDDEGYLLYNVKLSEIPTGNYISSLQFVVTWDPTQLEIKASRNGIALYTQPDENNETSPVSPTINNDETAGWTRYAIASSYGMSRPADGIVLTLKFKVKTGITSGTTINVNLPSADPDEPDKEAFKLSLVDSSEATVTFPAGTTFGTVAGSITTGSQPVDKTALQNLYNTNNALFIAAKISTDGNDVANGATWLTQANYSTDYTLLSNALTVLNNANATQEQIEAAHAALLNGFVVPTTAVVTTTTLVAAIAYAQNFIASDAFKECSEGLQKEWTAALAAAQIVYADTTHTQKEVDDAATKIYGLDKTGESEVVLVFAGITLLAVIGLGFAVRRRFN
ncbi:MAG: cohesin domain-containing protein [Clostridia bacterium]|nr:cohesin domain-containing protein [Clostridia bacterium]